MRCSVNKTDKKEAGFTLIEVAIGLIILGLILIPSLTLYLDFAKDADWQVTEDNRDAIQRELSGFNASFGRFPCPASSTAARGAANYGFELANCQTSVPPVGTCANGICAYASPNAGQIVLVGSLPFKNLGLFERQAYDGYNTKFTYAVTLNSTLTSTFSSNGGAVGIVKASDITLSAIVNPNTAHFVVISHGPNKAGAFTESAAQIPCMEGSLAEQENCDADAIFAAGDISDFDDRVTFFDSALPTEWKKDNANSTDIFLKDSNSIALGTANSTNVSAADHFSVRRVGADSGSVVSDENFFVERLCEQGATMNDDCFQPRLIAGNLTPDTAHPENRLEAVGGNGISCYDGTNDEYLVGIQSGTPRCADEIFLSCPNNSFIDGVDANGNIQCDAEPSERCAPDNTRVNTCGGAVALPDSASGTNSFSYSGECRMLPGTITTTVVRDDVRALMNQAIADHTVGTTTDYAAAIAQARPAIQAYIDGVNATARNVQQCSAVTSSPPGLVRDTYRCESGSWSVRSSHEIQDRSSFISSTTNSSSYWRAENSYVGDDLSNNNGYHDCWCREDYRVIFDGGLICPLTGAPGLRVRVQHHRCPQTRHRWTNVLDDRILFCGCAPGTEQEFPSCNSYYDTVNGTSGTTGLTGNVVLTYNTICNGSGGLIRDGNPPAVDTTACGCPSLPPRTERDFCPVGQTNSWTSPYGNETGVSGLRESLWSCPGGLTGGLPNPGSYGPFNPVTGVTIPSCACITTPVRERLDCPVGQAGLGIFYDAPRDCATGLAVTDQSLWVEASRDCRGCAWVPGPQVENTKFPLGVSGKEAFAGCSCGELDQAFCSEFNAIEDYKNWINCQCKPTSD